MSILALQKTTSGSFSVWVLAGYYFSSLGKQILAD